MTRPPRSPWRDRGALLALAPLGLLLLAVIVACPWYSNFDVDTLTWFEQMRAVADHGSVGFDNGPVEPYAELRTRWFVAAHGRAWGILPAPLCYLLAPFVMLGGYKGAVRAIWALLGLAALVSYALTHRLTGRPHVAVGAAYAVALGTSLGFWATMTAPFVPAAAFGIAAVYLGHRSFGHARLRSVLAWGLATGAVAGFALGSHLLFALAWALLGLACVALGPWRERAVRALAYGLGSAPSLALMGWVNHQRFGTWNPVSYGPCDSHSCTAQAANNQTAAAFAESVKPLVPWALAVAAALWAVRRSRAALATVVLLAASAALVPDTEAAEKCAPYLRALWGFVVSFGSLDVGFARGDDGLSNELHGWCVRSLLQCSPALILAVLGARGEPAPTASRYVDDPDELRRRAARWMLGAVALGVLAGAALRAETGGAYVWGWPFLNMRYMAPMLPALVVLAASAAAELPWRPAHAAAILGASLGGASWLWGLDEADAGKRWATHALPLGLAASSLCAVALARAERGRGGWASRVYPPLAAVVVAAALAYGVAVVAGVDARASRDYRGPQTERTLELARCAGAHRRFILLGGYAMDEALALHDARDILFVNLGMGPRDGAGALALLRRYESPARPAFLLQDDAHGPWHMAWEGFRVAPIAGCPRVLRVEREPGGVTRAP